MKKANEKAIQSNLLAGKPTLPNEFLQLLTHKQAKKNLVYVYEPKCFVTSQQNIKHAAKGHSSIKF